jgi:hypothetical protein
VKNYLLVWQAEVLLGRDVAQHGAAHGANVGGADGAGDVVVTGRNVRGQRAQGVERGLSNTVVARSIEATEMRSLKVVRGVQHWHRQGVACAGKCRRSAKQGLNVSEAKE